MVRGLKDTNKKGSKGKAQKKKMVFAKNSQQAILGISIFSFFLLKTGYDLSMYLYTEYFKPNQAQSTAKTIAQDQQKNLESLEKSPDGATTGNSNLSSDAPNPGGPASQIDSKVQADANNIYTQTVNMQNKSSQSAPQGSAMQKSQGAGGGIEIIPKTAERKRTGKMVVVQVADSGRSNPFLPAGENIVPSSLPKFNLMTPPESVSTDSDADKVMDTTISGILFDKYSPSAIINIGGTDYLVKRGDVINRYKILSIGKDQVVVQLGSNVYKAGVGQLLEQGKMNYNTVANLEKKFGGNEVSIGVRKKSYK